MLRRDIVKEQPQSRKCNCLSRKNDSVLYSRVNINYTSIAVFKTTPVANTINPVSGLPTNPVQSFPPVRWPNGSIAIPGSSSAQQQQQQQQRKYIKPRFSYQSRPVISSGEVAQLFYSYTTKFICTTAIATTAV